MTATAQKTSQDPFAVVQEREYPFTDREFETLANLVHNQAGIVLHKGKKNMVYGRLARRIRELGMLSFQEYLKYLYSHGGTKEISLLINAITTNLTKFFRESHHFDHLLPACLDILQAKTERGDKRSLRIWSAGCSSGEEPYSIAMAMQDLMEETGPIDIKILATDLDTNMLEIGREGKYNSKIFTDLPAKYRALHVTKIPGSQFEISRDLKNIVHFKQLNLLKPWPMTGPFDVIFCRNVMIYFDAKTKTKLAHGFADMMRPDSWLYIGHSETLSNKKCDLELLGKTIYRRKDHNQNSGSSQGSSQGGAHDSDG